jgi:hypothetical protein
MYKVKRGGNWGGEVESGSECKEVEVGRRKWDQKGLLMQIQTQFETSVSQKMKTCSIRIQNLRKR